MAAYLKRASTSPPLRSPPKHARLSPHLGPTSDSTWDLSVCLSSPLYFDSHLLPELHPPLRVGYTVYLICPGLNTGLPLRGRVWKEG